MGVQELMMGKSSALAALLAPWPLYAQTVLLTAALTAASDSMPFSHAWHCLQLTTLSHE